MNEALIIGIVNWNTKDYLVSCLESILKNVHELSYEVIVVDNNSSDGSSDMVKERFPWVRLIQNFSNACFARANNQIFEVASGDKFLILNPDVIIEKDAIAKMIHFLDSSAQSAAVCPKYLNPDGSFQRFYRRWPDIRVFLAYETKLLNIFPLLKKRILDAYHYSLAQDTFDKENDIVQPGISCLMLKTAVFKDASLFDERFPLFFNDVDLCRRIHNKGYKIFYLPQAPVTHYLGKGRSLDRETEYKEFLVGWLRYFKKYSVFSYVCAQTILICEFTLLTFINILAMVLCKKKNVGKNIRLRRDIVFNKSGF